MDSEHQDDDVVSRFKARRLRQFILVIPVMLAIFLLVWAGENQDASLAGIPRTVLVGVALAAIAAGAGFSLFNWRCPACGKYLGRSINPSFCAKCGTKLQ